MICQSPFITSLLSKFNDISIFSSHAQPTPSAFEPSSSLVVNTQTLVPISLLPPSYLPCSPQKMNLSIPLSDRPLHAPYRTGMVLRHLSRHTTFPWKLGNYCFPTSTLSSYPSKTLLRFNGTNYPSPTYSPLPQLPRSQIHILSFYALWCPPPRHWFSLPFAPDPYVTMPHGTQSPTHSPHPTLPHTPTHLLFPISMAFCSHSSYNLLCHSPTYSPIPTPPPPPPTHTCWFLFLLHPVPLRSAGYTPGAKNLADSVKYDTTADHQTTLDSTPSGMPPSCGQYSIQTGFLVDLPFDSFPR